jgi:glycosyltransferase involved in cell wall biosynthesis
LTLIKSWKNLPLEFKLVIVGDGPVCKLITDFIDTNKMYNVEYVGFKQGTELNNLIKNSSFIIVPSEWYENNPLTIIEAYANGKPVIGADIGGITEIIINKKTGFLFSSRNIEDLSSKIIEANALSEEKYKKMALEARKFAELNFDEETHYKRLLNLYKSII